MSEWEAPAKLNLDLRIARPDASGMHPLRSVVQAIEWCDLLTLEPGDDDALHITGPASDADLSEGDNLVWKAVAALGVGSRPRLDVQLDKHIAVAAGLGGGSSDAAATLVAVADLLHLPGDTVEAAARQVGSDVPFFLTGGTALMEGYGGNVTPLSALAGFAVAVVVPDFELATPAVYRAWDDLDAPTGPEFPATALPPELRAEGPFRNDLLPAALALRPELADWMADLADSWGRPVMMSGSGPSCFGYFLDEDEAAEALEEVRGRRAGAAVPLRPRGVGVRDG